MTSYEALDARYIYRVISELRLSIRVSNISRILQNAFRVHFELAQIRWYLGWAAMYDIWWNSISFHYKMISYNQCVCFKSQIFRKILFSLEVLTCHSLRSVDQYSVISMYWHCHETLIKTKDAKTIIRYIPIEIQWNRFACAIILRTFALNSIKSYELNEGSTHAKWKKIIMIFKQMIQKQNKSKRKKQEQADWIGCKMWG